MTQPINRQDAEVRPIPGLVFWGALLRLVARISPGIASRVGIFLFTIPGRKARHFRQDQLLQSARRTYVLDGRRKIRVYAWGAGESRILLAHGWQSRGTALRYFVPVLVERGFSVVAMDAPGHGESSGWRTSLSTYAQAIRLVDQQFGPFTGAITHSFGGRALTYAMAYEPNDWQIRRVVMLAAPSSFADIIDRFSDQLNMPANMKPAILARMEELLGRPVDDSEIHNLGTRVHAQIIVIHDEEDNIVPMWEAERIATRLPGVRLIKTRGFGHYRMAKSPEIWEIAVKFLTKGQVH
ncbi:MAG: alpha/beta hydrolase [Saprospiraceae bacterium]